MKCGHCGDPIFAFEFWVEATDGKTIHNFGIECGQNVCMPNKKLEVSFGEVVEFPDRNEKSVAI